MAYSEPAVALLDRFGNRPGLIELSLKTGIARFILRIKAVEAYLRTLDDVVELFSGSSVYYRPELDAYSGVLAHDLGMEEAFESHARKVARGLSGKKVVVIDPHTAYALSELYPKYVDGFDVEVFHYTELLDVNFAFQGRIAYQEPCYLLRHFKKEGIRPVLESIKGLQLKRVKATCCGGPIEFLFGEQSKSIAKRRGEELGAGRFVVACPVCMASFRRAGYRPIDLATLLKFSVKSRY